MRAGWWRRVVGLDGFEVGLQVAITGVILFWIGATNNRFEDVVVLGSMTLVASLVLLAIRRGLALKSAQRLDVSELGSARITELEQRIAELEADQVRLTELEERVDFAERLLARRQESPRELAP